MRKYRVRRAAEGHLSGHAACAVCSVSPRAATGRGGGARPHARADANAALQQRIVAIHAASRATYGAPRIHAELRAQGERCSRKRVARLMRLAGVAGCHRRRFRTTRRDPARPSAPDLVQRAFVATAPNQVWVADLTYVPTRQGFLFLAVVLDACCRRVVGWSMAAHLRAELVLAALEMALQHRRPAAGVIHHSDHGSQYTAAAFQERCRRAGCPLLDGLGRRLLSTTPWPKASLPPWSASCSRARSSEPMPRPERRSLTSSRSSTIASADTPRSAISPQRRFERRFQETPVVA